MSFIVPNAPNPDDSQYRQNPLAFNRAVHQWMNQVKGKLEQSQVLSNGIPIAAPQHGDIAYKGSAAWARLPAGTSGQLLQTQGASANPQWAGLSSSIDAAIGGTQGDILYRGTSAWSRLAAGTSGDLLMTQGAAANPLWATRPRVKVGSTTRDVAAADGTQSITGLGFKPKSVAIAAAINNSAAACVGFSDASSNVTLHGNADGVTPTAHSVNNAACAFLYVSSGNYSVASVAALGTDGFSLAWNKTGAPTGTASIGFLATG